MPNDTSSKKSYSDEQKAELLKHFGELLNAFEPRIESQASKDSGLTVTLHFAPEIETTAMRKIATMVADHIA